MEQELSKWAARVRGVTGEAQGRRYPPAARRAAVDLVQRALAAGMALEPACRALGVPSITVKRWMRECAGMVAVEVSALHAERVRLHVGAAHVDLTLAQLAALLGCG